MFAVFFESIGTIEWVLYYLVILLLGGPTPPESEVTLYYMNPRNYSQELISVTNSSFLDPNKETCIVIHGFTESHTDGSVVPTATALAKSGKNVIVVDYASIANWRYIQAVAHLHVVAKVVSSYIINNKLDPSNILLVGFSLGAHAAGFIGKNVKASGGEIGKIMGMEPAQPMYGKLALVPPEHRLDKNDAADVITVETNGGVFGTSFPIGNLHFRINNGFYQPGCSLTYVPCSHERVMDLFAYSIEYNNLVGQNDAGDRIILNADIPDHASGIYVIRTTGAEPWAVN